MNHFINLRRLHLARETTNAYKKDYGKNIGVCTWTDATKFAFSSRVRLDLMMTFRTTSPFINFHLLGEMPEWYNRMSIDSYQNNVTHQVTELTVAEISERCAKLPWIHDNKRNSLFIFSVYNKTKHLIGMSAKHAHGNHLTICKLTALTSYIFRMTVVTDFSKGYVSNVEAITSSSTLSSINNSTLEEERLSIGPFRLSFERIRSELYMTNHCENGR